MTRPADGYTLLLVGPANAISAHALCQSQLQLPARHRAGRRHHPRTPGHGGAPVGAGDDGCASSSPMPRPTRARSRWPRPATAARPMCPGELFKMMTGLDLPVSALFRRRPRAQGHDRRAGAGDVRTDVGGDRADQSGKLRPLAVTTTTRVGGAARCPCARRCRAGLRGERGDWHRRSQQARRRTSSPRSTRRSMRPLRIPR